MPNSDVAKRIYLITGEGKNCRLRVAREYADNPFTWNIHQPAVHRSFFFNILSNQHDVYLCLADSSTLLHSCPYPYHTLCHHHPFLNRYRHCHNVLTYLKSACLHSCHFFLLSALFQHIKKSLELPSHQQQR